MSASVTFQKPCNLASEGVNVHFTQYEGRLTARVCSMGKVVINGVPLGSFDVTLDLRENDWKLYNFSYPKVDFSHSKGKYVNCSSAAYKKILEFSQEIIKSTWKEQGQTIYQDLKTNGIKEEHEGLISAVQAAHAAYIKASEELAVFEDKHN